MIHNRDLLSQKITHTDTVDCCIGMVNQNFGSDGVKTTYTYPSSGNKGLPLSVTVSDSSGSLSSTTSYTYTDDYNYLLSVTDPSGAVTRYEYDYGADEIINKFGNGSTYRGMDRERIAVELYGHAMAHYWIPILKETPLYDKYKDDIDSLYNSSNPIDINNDDERIILCYAIWEFF